MSKVSAKPGPIQPQGATPVKFLETISKLVAALNPSFPRRRESIGFGQRRGEISETDWF